MDNGLGAGHLPLRQSVNASRKSETAVTMVNCCGDQSTLLLEGGGEAEHVNLDLFIFSALLALIWPPGFFHDVP